MTKTNSHFLTLILEGKVFSRQHLEIFSYYYQAFHENGVIPYFQQKKTKKKKKKKKKKNREILAIWYLLI